MKQRKVIILTQGGSIGQIQRTFNDASNLSVFVKPLTPLGLLVDIYIARTTSVRVVCSTTRFEFSRHMTDTFVQLKMYIRVAKKPLPTNIKVYFIIVYQYKCNKQYD